MKRALLVLVLAIGCVTPSFAALTDFNSKKDVEAAAPGAEKEMAKSFIIAGQKLKYDMDKKKSWDRVRDIFMFKKPINKQEALYANKAQSGLKAKTGDSLILVVGEGPTVSFTVDDKTKEK